MGRETWLVLEDGKIVNPNECLHGEGGMLAHKSGVPVAMRGEFHHSAGVDVGDDGKLVNDKSADAKEPDKKPASEDRQVTAEKENAAEYKTR